MIASGNYARIWRATTLRKGNVMPIGTVKFFNDEKGFGFIQPEDGSKDAFVHKTAVQAAGMRSLSEGQRIEYELREDRPGKMAAVELKEA